MRLLILLPLLLFLSCFPDFTPAYKDRVIAGKDSIANGTVELYHYTAAYGDSPFYVVIQQEQVFDTICIATNAASVCTKNSDTIVIGFTGSPAFFDSSINVPTSVKNYQIEIDTTTVGRHPQVVRKWI